MLDMDTFLVEVYCLADAFCKGETPASMPGPPPRLTSAEMLTLAITAQHRRFESTRAFYRFAARHLRGAFPGLPSREQFVRRLVRERTLVEAFSVALPALADADAPEPGAPRRAGFEILDGLPVPTRSIKRSGSGHLAGQADIGLSTRLGFYEGVRVLAACRPDGLVTGFVVAAASVQERLLAESLLALRSGHLDGVATGGAFVGTYLADKGFEGKGRCARWSAELGADVITPPRRTARQRWSPRDESWSQGLRQVVETVFERLLMRCGLNRERPHALGGLLARVAAAVGLHNATVLLNRRHGRPALAFLDPFEA